MSNARTDSVLITVRRLLQQERNEEVIHLIEALLPADQAEVFLALPEQVQEEILEQIKIQDAADIIEELSDDDAAALAETLDLTVLTQLLDEMEPDEAADLLGDLDPALRDRALAQMISVEAVAPLLGYSDDSAGGLMTSNYHVFSEQTSIGQAFRAIREQPTQDDEEIPYVYAVDERGRLTGIARLADLIRAHPDQPLSAIAKREIVSIGADEDQEAAARLLERYDLMALPVLDDRQRLVGVITADDAMAALEEETTEDIYRSAGIYAGGEPNTSKSALLVEGPVWHAWAQRVPFLLISMVGGMLAGGVMGLFEEALEVVVALAFFVPVVMDMGGNAGVQSAAIFIRGQVLGHVDTTQFVKHFLREISVGIGMGVILGLLAGVIAGLWQGMPEIGLVVGLSLICTMTLATSLGYLIPFILMKLGADPAVGSDPIITTIKDITGLFIYFTIASLILL
jgi:magnesium transporter